MIKDAKEFNYHSFHEIIVSLAKKNGFKIHSYSPYKDYPELKTVFIYNSSFIKSETATIHISATHGIEGYAGAFVQKYLLEKHSEELLKSNNGVLFVFALNPFGFHFLRRTSLENIDLNRNLGDGLEHPPYDHSLEWLRPFWRSHGLFEQLRGLTQTLSLCAFKGFNSVSKIFAEGQAIEPEGLFFTGKKMALEIQSFINQSQNLFINKKRLRFLDIHTGLGKLYEELLFHCAGSLEWSQNILGSKVEVPGERPNSYRGQGLLADRLVHTFPETNIQFVVQELGIKSSAHSLLALSMENSYHWSYFPQTPESLYLKHPIKKLMLNTFFSYDPEWLHWLEQEGSLRFLSFFRAD